MEVLTLALTAFKMVGDNKRANRSEDIQRESNAVQKAQGEIQNDAARRGAIREAMMKRSRLLQMAYNSGVGRSSGEIGSMGAMSGELSKNIALQTQSSKYADSMSHFNSQLSSLQSAQTRSDDLFALVGKGLEAADSFDLFKKK